MRLYFGRVMFASVALLGVAGVAFADGQDDRAKLTGKWQGASANWMIEQNGDSVHIVNSNGAQTVEDISCSTSGKECAVKNAGHSAKVSMWFNGAKLVELETTGNSTVKRRFSVSGNGDTLDVETIPVTAGGTGETVHYKRATAETARQ